MFGNLTDYENQDFYKEHKNIILYTEECQRNYEIIAVFRSQVYRKTDQVFKFYKFSRRIRRKNLMTFITISSSYPSMTPVSPQSSEIIF